MRNIIDIGERGSQKLGNFRHPQPEAIDHNLPRQLALVKRFPLQAIEVDTVDGVKKSVQVRTMLLSNPAVFRLVWSLAAHELMVFARHGGQAVQGMLSANFDTRGTSRLPAIKVIPLQNSYPLTSRLLPDPRMATMLAGAVSAERAGVGGHDGVVTQDFEHRATILGAISVDTPDIALSHQNHGVRRSGSSVATGLTNGRLGSMYQPDAALGEFTGYGAPVLFDEKSVQPADAIFIPDSFIGEESSFGRRYPDASKIMLGAGLEALYARRGSNIVTSQISLLGEQMRTS